MRYQYIICTGLLAFISFNCSKQNEIHDCTEGTPVDLSIGPSYANSNLMDWSNAGAIYSTLPTPTNSFNLRIGKLNYDKCDYYEIDLNNLPLSEAKLDLNLLQNTSNFNSNLTIIHGGDAIAEQYELVDTFNNTISINEVRLDEIIGEYSLAFKVSKNSLGRGLYDTTLPAILYFQDGTFTAKLIK